MFSLKDASIPNTIKAHQRAAKKVTNIKEIPFLRAGPTIVEINPRHTYYDQIQGQLHLSSKYRDFINDDESYYL